VLMMTQEKRPDGWKVGKLTSPVQPEVSIAKGLLVRLLLIAPILIVGGALWSGLAGVESAAYGTALVAVNFVVLILVFREGARYQMAGIMVAAFVALILVLAILTAATIPVVHAPWMRLPIFGVAVIIGHLGAVVLEGRRVSGRLGDNGLGPWRMIP